MTVDYTGYFKSIACLILNLNDLKVVKFCFSFYFLKIVIDWNIYK